jgi:hypothetical protein
MESRERQLRGAIVLHRGQPGVVFTAGTALPLSASCPLNSLRKRGPLGFCATWGQRGCGALWTVTCFIFLALVSFLLHGVAFPPGESNWCSSDPHAATMGSLWLFPEKGPICLGHLSTLQLILPRGLGSAIPRPDCSQITEPTQS